MECLGAHGMMTRNRCRFALHFTVMSKEKLKVACLDLYFND